MIFNKLVRDKIPEIIAQQGKKVTFRAVRGEELKQALKDKLIEEAIELVNAETEEQIIEEIADLQEVLAEITREFIETGCNFPKVDNMRNKKEREKGGFEKGYFLESVEDEDEQSAMESNI